MNEEETIKKIEEILAQTPDWLEREFERNLLTSCLRLPEDELKIYLPNGSYQIGTKQFPVITGRDGYINYVLEIKRQIKNK